MMMIMRKNCVHLDWSVFGVCEAKKKKNVFVLIDTNYIILVKCCCLSIREKKMK